MTALEPFTAGLGFRFRKLLDNIHNIPAPTHPRRFPLPSPSLPFLSPSRPSPLPVPLPRLLRQCKTQKCF